jgi:ADP-ribosylglycohydrolase
MSLAVECARTTHQSPLVLDACRYFSALLVGALRGAGQPELLAGLYEPVPGAWRARPLKAEIVAAATGEAPARDSRPRAAEADVLQALATVRASLAASVDVASAIDAAVRGGSDPALDAALAGALAGALHGARAIPPEAVSGLRQHELLEQFASRLVGHHAAHSGRGDSGA